MTHEELAIQRDVFAEALSSHCEQCLTLAKILAGARSEEQILRRERSLLIEEANGHCKKLRECKDELKKARNEFTLAQESGEVMVIVDDDNGDIDEVHLSQGSAHLKCVGPEEWELHLRRAGTDDTLIYALYLHDGQICCVLNAGSEK